MKTDLFWSLCLVLFFFDQCMAFSSLSNQLFFCAFDSIYRHFILAGKEPAHWFCFPWTRTKWTLCGLAQSPAWSGNMHDQCLATTRASQYPIQAGCTCYIHSLVCMWLMTELYFFSLYSTSYFSKAMLAIVKKNIMEQWCWLLQHFRRKHVAARSAHKLTGRQQSQITQKGIEDLQNIRAPIQPQRQWWCWLIDRWIVDWLMTDDDAKLL